MKINPLVSVVLPTYNGSRYLSESIRSVVGQTYQNWELIIVDDGREAILVFDLSVMIAT